MKLFIAEGNTSQAAYQRLFARVKECDTPESFHVFLVPDRYTLSVERDLIRYCFPDGYARADVVSFTRFAVKCVGKSINTCLSKEGTVVLLRKVLQKTDTRYYKKLSGYDFAKELFAAIASLRTAGITVEDILREAEQTEGVLGDKLHDIALVEKGYEEEIRDRFSDTVTRIDALEEYAKNADWKNTHFYILGFSIFSVQQLRIMKVLAKRAASVNVSAVLPCGGTPCPGGQVAKLAESCRLEGVDVVREEAFLPVKEDFEYLRSSLFNPYAKKKEMPIDAVLFREASPSEEILAAAREIKYLVKKEKYRYKDIAVIVNDDAYLPVLRETFDRCEIPSFIDEGYPFCESLAARFVFSLLAAAEYRQESAFFKLARHPYLGLSTADAENFVKYCKKYGIRHLRFAEPFVLGEYQVAEEVRKTVHSLVKKVPQEGTAAEYGKFLSDLITTEVADRVTEEQESLKNERDIASAIREPLIKITEEFGLLAGEERFGCFEYASALRSALADVKTVLKPAFIDAVFVGNTEESRFDGVKAAFFLGCNAETFPKKSGDGLIFTAFDNEAMRQKNMAVFPSPIERNALERFVLKDVLGKFSDRIYFGTSETAPDGTEQEPGDGIEEVAYYVGQDVKQLRPLSSFRNLSGNEALSYRLVNDKNARYEYLRGGLGEYTASVEKYLTAKGLLTDVPSEDDTFFYNFEKEEDGFIKTNVSHLETYFSCPFKYFMQYGLRIKEEEDSTIKVNAIGIIIHSVLERFFRAYGDKIDEQEDFSKEIEEVVASELKKEEYKIYYEDLLSRHVMSGIKKECTRMLPALIDNMRHSKFRPIGYEVSFGYRKGENMILLNANNNTFKVVGKVDRVDAYGQDVAIIDYKTGNTKPSFASVFYGEKVQLYVYLKHYLDLGYKPAGVFYLPIRGENVSGGRSYTMLGQMKRDVDTYYAFDDRAESEDNEGTFHSKTLAINLQNKKGVKSFSPQTTNAIGEETFLSIVQYVQLLCEKALSEITDGYAEKKPCDEDVCKYCPYRRICGPVPVQSHPSIKNPAFSAALEKERGENG